MTTFLKSRTVLGAAAIGTAVLGCTAISAETDTMESRAFAQDTAPIACTITVERSNGGLLLEPIVQASEAVTGIYQLRVEGPGTRMNQGGPFSARAGQTVQLGRMMLGGTGSNLEAEMTLTIDGRAYSCPVDL